MLDVLPYLVAGWIFLVGCYGVVTSRHLVTSVVCVGVVQSSTYLLLLAIGWTRNGTAPVFNEVGPKARVADPVVQAMTLTDVVVGATVTALLLALAIQVAKRHTTLDPREIRSMEEESEE